MIALTRYLQFHRPHGTVGADAENRILTTLPVVPVPERMSQE